MTAIPVALQMFTLREESSKDFTGTLKKVAELGYEGIEFAGYGDLTTTELKVVMDDLGLRAAASHIPLIEMEADLTKIIDDQHRIGSNKLVCPYLPPERRTEEDYRELITLLNRFGDTCSKEGITLCYHNHDFELEKLSDGRTALETIFEETNPEWVKAEFDIYWLTRAGQNPLAWIKQYPNRTPLIHLKDMTTDEERFFAELGTGGVDIESVLEKGEEANVEWWVVEQDRSRRSPLESIEISMKYLKKRLPHLANV
ncbi:sugar phosphate isomerase/epimerase family protein [Peribacillus sp. JNUCC 23]|uniref:sugar phosphate isomerase/epimerase family protein n=1 Tax=Peribacillus sp. NPDC096379 TaxID=3364393 RepID=UPI00381BFE48